MRTDGEVVFTYASPGLRDLLGIDPADLAADATTFLTRLHPGDRDRYYDALRRAARDLSPRIVEFRVQAADGSIKWLRDSAQTSRTAQGDVVWDGFLQDSSDDKRQDDTLRAAHDEMSFAHERLRKTLEGISDGIVLWDADDRLVLCNQRFRSFYRDIADRILPGARFDDVVEAAAERVLLAADEESPSDWRQKRIALHRAGGAMGEEFLRDGRCLLIRESHLSDGGVVSIYTDITSRKKAEQDLHKLSLAVSQSSAAIVISNTQGIIEYVNPHFTTLTGYAAEEAIGRTPRLLKSGRMAQQIYKELWDTILAGRRWRGELLNRKKNGELYWEDLSISPVADDRGRVSHFVAVSEDITGRKRSEEALRRSEREIRAILDNMTDIFFRCDLTGRIVMASKSAAEITGTPLSRVLSSNLRDLFTDAAEARRFFAAMEECGGRLTGFEMSLKRVDGSTVVVSINARYFQGESGNIAGVEGIMRDITELNEARRKLEQIAHRDPLTGLANRRLFEDHLALALARIRRSQGSAALLYIDLDGFKAVNDTHGHAFGDRLLSEVAARLRASVREKDIIARFGGDEFIILLEDLNYAVDAERVAAKVVETVALPYVEEGVRVEVGASVGIVYFNAETSDGDRLLRFADRAMYRAKGQGRGTYCVFDSAIDGDAPRRQPNNG